MNSIVFTDSFPGLALFFKALNLEVFDNGQYFGIGLLVSAVALFLGGRKLFLRLGLSFWPALLAAAILSTTPLFWWMQRWYPALSSGVPLLVWAFYIYLDKELSSPRLFRRWLALLVAALATQASISCRCRVLCGNTYSATRAEQFRAPHIGCRLRCCFLSLHICYVCARLLHRS